MFSKEDKKRLSGLLKTHKLNRQSDVFKMIERGATPTEVETFVQQLIDEAVANQKPTVDLLDKPHAYNVFGRHLIAQNTTNDMNAIMRLPYVISGALMPDGHRVQENHVPVGGVVLSDALVPGIVGSDIACSVLLTITDHVLENEWLDQAMPSLKYVLKNQTYFGQEINPDPVVFEQPFYHENIGMESGLGRQIYDQVKKIARNHFGTSGDGNHFIEIGGVNVQPNAQYAVQQNTVGFHAINKKRYLAILTHFGSRAVGSTIADAFQAEALALHTMPKGMSDAPLDPSSPLGRDYWRLMNWAGAFAEAGHRWLHTHVLQQLGTRVQLGFTRTHSIYSRHNFAWQTEQGYLHRKGATPAEQGEYGVIPATMGDQTQIVVGLGNAESIHSASHGAGRLFSRGAAIQQFGKSDTAALLLKEYNVHLLGGGPDEDPRAYKQITDVMDAQQTCVTSIGNFQPAIVRMADPRFTWR